MNCEDNKDRRNMAYTGLPIKLSMTKFRSFHISFERKLLERLGEKLDNNTTTMNFEVVASYEIDPVSNAFKITLIRLREDAKMSLRVIDFVADCKVSAGTMIEATPEDLNKLLKTLEGNYLHKLENARIVDQVLLHLSACFQTSCIHKDKECILEATLIHPSQEFEVVPIQNLPLASTALSKSLEGTGIGFMSGFLIRDNYNRLVPVMKSDHRISIGQPLLVGVWVVGVEDVSDVMVWLNLLQYSSNQNLQSRICRPHEPFILMTSSSSQLRFFECNPIRYADPARFLIGQATVPLRQFYNSLPNAIVSMRVAYPPPENRKHQTFQLAVRLMNQRFQSQPIERNNINYVNDVMPRPMVPLKENEISVIAKTSEVTLFLDDPNVDVFQAPIKSSFSPDTIARTSTPNHLHHHDTHHLHHHNVHPFRTTGTSNPSFDRKNSFGEESHLARTSHQNDGRRFNQFDLGKNSSNKVTIASRLSSNNQVNSPQQQHQMNSHPFQQQRQVNSPPFQQQHQVNSPPFQQQHQVNSPPFQQQHQVNSPPFQQQHQVNSQPFQQQRQMNSPPFQQQQQQTLFNQNLKQNIRGHEVDNKVINFSPLQRYSPGNMSQQMTPEVNNYNPMNQRQQYNQQQQYYQHNQQCAITSPPALQNLQTRNSPNYNNCNNFYPHKNLPSSSSSSSKTPRPSDHMDGRLRTISPSGDHALRSNPTSRSNPTNSTSRSNQGNLTPRVFPNHDRVMSGFGEHIDSLDNSRRVESKGMCSTAVNTSIVWSSKADSPPLSRAPDKNHHHHHNWQQESRHTLSKQHRVTSPTTYPDQTEGAFADFTNGLNFEHSWQNMSEDYPSFSSKLENMSEWSSEYGSETMIDEEGVTDYKDLGERIGRLLDNNVGSELNSGRPSRNPRGNYLKDGDDDDDDNDDDDDDREIDDMRRFLASIDINLDNLKGKSMMETCQNVTVYLKKSRIPSDTTVWFDSYAAKYLNEPKPRTKKIARRPPSEATIYYNSYEANYTSNNDHDNDHDEDDDDDDNSSYSNNQRNKNKILWNSKYSLSLPFKDQKNSSSNGGRCQQKIGKSNNKHRNTRYH